MSEPGNAVKRWEGPSFGPALVPEERISVEELESQAKARGFEIGKMEGLKSGRSEAKKILERMTALADEMVNPFRSLDQLVVKELAVVAMSLSRHIVRRELSLNSEIIEQIATEAISTLSSLKGEVDIYIHPDDAALVHQVAEDKLRGKEWKLVEDSTILPGGCRIKTASSFVDASIEKQMEWVFGAAIETCEDKLDD